MRYTLFSLAVLLLSGCSQNAKKDTLFSLEEQTGINFVNTVTDQADHNIFKYRNFYNGGGVAIGDINNDGLSDVFFTANQGPNKLYLNKGNFKFEDISEAAGFGEKKQWSTGVVFVDINHDGFLDIYVCNAGHMQDPIIRKNQLFINDGNLKFTEQAAAYGLDNDGYTTHASFFDYDMDGDLDCFMVNNSPLPVNTLNYANARNVRAENSPVADFLKGGGDHLFRNDNNRFTEVSAEAGIHGTLISFGLGVTTGDVNGDGWPDVYVSNDFFERDYLYINQKNGKFKDELEEWIGHTSLASMGTDIADVNNDGYPDIFSTDMLPGDDYRLKTTTAFDNIDVYRLKQSSGFHQQFMQNALQLNNRNGKFKEIAYKTGVEASDWSWGELMFDADNNGLIDIYVCNGIARDLTNQDFIDFFANDIVKEMVLKGKKDDVSSIVDKMPSQKIPNKMYSNQGDLSFKEVGKEWGMDEPSFSNGAAYGDLDNDGDLDLVINNVNQPAFVYRNNNINPGNKSPDRNNKTSDNSGADAAKENHYLGLLLKGKDKNTHAIGARIFLHAGEQVFMRDIMPARGFQSSVDYKQIIGTGNIKKYDSLKILWPDNTISSVNKLYSDTVMVFDQSELPASKFQAEDITSTTLLSIDNQQFTAHKENDHVDFYAERNIPVMLSREGPDAAVADVNGDQLEDLFICGAHNQNGKLYLQQPNGSFVLKGQPSIEAFVNREDVAAIFFDANNDNAPDLFVGSGGNDKLGSGKLLQHRFFLNDGKGNFTYDSTAFPVYGFNVGAVVNFDIDGDGDQDLFVGSRNTPFAYGVSPDSYVYLNDGKGKFKNVSSSVSADLKALGMITDAVVGDITGDGKPELVVVGEWMEPVVFTIQNGKLNKLKTNLSPMSGWWRSVKIEDLDKDGMNDLVLGNIGDNSFFRPAEQNPIKLWLNDFDNNGSKEKIMTKTIDGKDYPVFLKHNLEEQLPVMKKQNLKHEIFATKTFQELFTPDQVKNASFKTFNYCSSVIAWNKGNGNFEIVKLPVDVQLSSVNAISIADVNADGNNDIILGGNEFGFLPQFGRLDASFGTILLNNGKRSFSVVDDRNSGLMIRGQVRNIVNINRKNSTGILFLVNDEMPVLYNVKKD